MISVIKIVEDTTVDGPGFRTTVYAAGCPNACPGCHNPSSWRIEAGHMMTTDDIMQVIRADEFADVTFSGGDPMFQPEGFAELAAKFRGVAAIEKSHEERYRKLLQNVETKQVFEKSGVQVWECRNCGHLVVGTKAPEVCPVCNHPQAYFEVRKENY